MKERKRVVIIVLDGLGVGELPDAAAYGDEGSHTLDNTARAAGGALRLPTLTALGLGLVPGVSSVARVEAPLASYGRMREASAGKDTTTGHWELAGVIMKNPFATFPRGFPPELMREFELATGRGWLWARPASGTEVIERLGAEHMKTGRLIVYTSADSVFQIAAHEDAVPVAELYRICEVCRGFLDRYNIGRVIARPFKGAPGSFERTGRRKDFSMEPPGETLLDRVRQHGLETVGIGKVGDIFAHRGLTGEVHASGNTETVDRVLEAMKRVQKGVILANLNDFDTLYGHRNDAPGFARALEEADGRLAEITEMAGPDDMLIVTADHGCDPTTASTDHSREHVPLIVYGKGFLKKGAALGTRESFADAGQTVAGFLGCGRLENGRSFLEDML